MKSEELELSLRTEFESYLKGVLAGVKQDVSDFQKNFESEFVKHKAQLDESIRNLATRFESEPEFDRAFSESVIEHLRLARDEGATVTANAIGAAEELKEATATPASYDLIRDAINDITSQNSQSAILKSLVEQAGNFAPRGAFFIVKHDHFVGWKAYGNENVLEDKAVQEVHFPISADTIFSSAAKALATRDVPFGEHADDNLFLEPLGFGRPDRMYAIPLTARGRGVAVMYADYGTKGVKLTTDALETLVRVAGLTVELLAASNEAKSQQDSGSAAAQPVQPAAEAPPEATPDADTEQFSTATTAVETTPVVEYAGDVTYDAAVDYAEVDATAATADSQDAVDEVSYFEPVVEPEPASIVQNEAPAENEFSFDTRQTETSFDRTFQEPTPASVPEPVEEYAVNGNGGPAVKVLEPAVEAAAIDARNRLSSRNVDLPIDVSEDERRIHNDARRFARLLVSEIKLYNEQKVAEGREARDLYDRLREAIDRSREMYEKRVQPQVAARFDYFHYELVNGLAEGSDERLGQSYPGATA